MSLSANHEASAYGFSPGAPDGDSQGFPVTQIYATKAEKGAPCISNIFGLCSR